MRTRAAASGEAHACRARCRDPPAARCTNSGAHTGARLPRVTAATLAMSGLS
jgi:hypothetical protein